MLGTVQEKMAGSASLSYTINMSHKMQQVKKRPVGEGQSQVTRDPLGSAHSASILVLCMLLIHSLPFPSPPLILD